MGTFYLDYENGNDDYGGTSFAPLASGTDGRISSSIFSSSSANFANDGTIAGSVNILGSAERFDNNNPWNLINVTATPASISPPASGLDQTWLITENTSAGTHDVRTTSSIYSLNITNTYTISYYVKSNGTNEVTIKFGTNSIRSARFDIINGTVSQVAASATAAISGIGDGWYRISLTVTTPNSSTDAIFLGLTNNSYASTDIQSYTGNGTNGIYLSSPQLEQSGSVTSYQKPPYQYLSIWNGSAYVTYLITSYISSTSLHITPIFAGTSLANQSVNRQYYIGGRWKTFANGANATKIMPGDKVRVMASPSPTSVGNATFVSSISENALSIQSSTNTSPITINRSSHGYSTGDTVFIYNHTTNTNANGTWEITVTDANSFTLNNSTGNGAGPGTGSVRRINSHIIKLDNSVTQNIASFGNAGEGRTVWTSANANITTSFLTTDYKEGSASDQIAVGAGFTTGKAAYKTLSSALDLSSYQQVSFWIKQTTGTAIINGDISLALCSDSTGDTVVNTINIPALVLTGRWVPFVVDLNTNLGSTINSIALYINVDSGAETFLLSNIIACKASSSDDSLNLTSLIGKNTSNEKWWAPIQSINGTRIILDQSTVTTPSTTSLRGYSGTSETITLYKRETIKTTMVTGSNNTPMSVTMDSGYSNMLTTIDFGYDRSSMSTLVGESFFDGQNSIGIGLYPINRNYMAINNFGGIRYSYAIQPQGMGFCSFDNHHYIGCSANSSYYYAVNNVNISNIISSFNSSQGFYMGVNCTKVIGNNILALSNAAYGIYIDYSYNSDITNSKSINNTSGGIFKVHCINFTTANSLFKDNSGFGMGTSSGSSNNFFIGCTTQNNAYSVACFGAGVNFVKNCILQESTEATSFITYSNGRTILTNNDNTDTHYDYTDGGIIYSTSLVRHSDTGFAWALSPTSASIRTQTYPLDLSIAKIAVSSNKLVTIKAWMRRSNALLFAGLRIKGGQISGVTNDITSYMTSPADTWEQLTLTFTPTEVGVVEVLAECYGGSTYTAYIDDLIITQI